MHPRGSKHVEGAKNWTKSLIWIVYIALVNYNIMFILLLLLLSLLL